MVKSANLKHRYTQRKDLIVASSTDDVWIDVYNRDHNQEPVKECDGTGEECNSEIDVYSLSSDIRLSLIWWDNFKVKEEKNGSIHGCLKYKYDSKKSESKLEDEDCDKSQPAACYIFCSNE